MSSRLFVALCLVPLAIFALTFLALPIVRLILSSGEGEAGWGIFLQILQTPRYLTTLVQTVLVSLAVTVVALSVSTTAGVFLTRNRFRGRAVLLSILTLPLAFPGVVVGFMIILLGGRQGLFNAILPGHVVLPIRSSGCFWAISISRSRAFC